MPFSVRFATETERHNWDALVQQNPDGGQWTQGEAFAEIKAPDRLRPVHLVFEGDATIAALAMEHSSAAGKFWYFPLGPGARIEQYPAIVDCLRAAAGSIAKGVFAIKVEPFVVDTPEHRAILTSAGLQASAPIQKNLHTVLVDLVPEPDAIFAGFTKNLRNHIRFAMKNGYRVEKVEPTEATFRTMYELLQTIAGGKGSELTRSYEYYHRVWTALCDRGQGHFWFGYDGAHAGPQASAFMINYGTTAIAKDGGSVPDRAIRGGAHLIRWEAMQWFKEHRGATLYDTYVTPPSWEQDDESHPMYGPGKFKRAFAPITDHVPSHDLVLDEKKFVLFTKLLLPIEWRVRRRPHGIW